MTQKAQVKPSGLPSQTFQVPWEQKLAPETRHRDDMQCCVPIPGHRDRDVELERSPSWARLMLLLPPSCSQPGPVAPGEDPGTNPHCQNKAGSQVPPACSPSRVIFPCSSCPCNRSAAGNSSPGPLESKALVFKGDLSFSFVSLKMN